MIITKEIEWDMGHRVPNHKSKCFNVHGHRYRAEVAVDSNVIDTSGASDEGMVIDFGDLKQIMMEEIDARFDHGYMIYEQDEFLPYFQPMISRGMKIITVPFVPTAENIAKHIYSLLFPRLVENGIRLKYVRIWETPTSAATWEG